MCGAIATLPAAVTVGSGVVVATVRECDRAHARIRIDAWTLTRPPPGQAWWELHWLLRCEPRVVRARASPPVNVAVVMVMVAVAVVTKDDHEAVSKLGALLSR